MKRFFGVLLVIGIAAVIGWVLRDGSHLPGLSRGEVSRKPAGAILPQARMSSLMPGMSLADLGLKLPAEPEAERIQLFYSSEETEALNHLYADRNTIDAARNILINEKPSWEMKIASKRLKAIDYLAAALAYRENPAMDYLLTTVKDIITADVFSRLDDKLQKTFMAGDKAELFTALIRSQPNEAADLYRKTRGTKLTPILEVARTAWKEARSRDASL